jgi:hypothetical protein
MATGARYFNLTLILNYRFPLFYSMAAGAVLELNIKFELVLFAILLYGCRRGIINLTLNLNWQFSPFYNMVTRALV